MFTFHRTPFSHPLMPETPPRVLTCRPHLLMHGIPPRVLTCHGHGTPYSYAWDHPLHHRRSSQATSRNGVHSFVFNIYIICIEVLTPHGTYSHMSPPPMGGLNHTPGDSHLHHLSVTLRNPSSDPPPQTPFHRSRGLPRALTLLMAA